MRLMIVRYGLALLFSAPLFAAPPPSVILSRTDAHTPIFISASAMVATDGTTAAVVPEDWRVQQKRIAEAFSEHRPPVSAFGVSSAAPCQAGMLVESPLERMVDNSTRNAAIVNAHAIVAGTIRSVTPGLFFGTPGSLIELGQLDKIKTDSSYDGLQDSLYLRLPYAQFVVGGIEYCRESSPGAYAPKVGDRLLVFAYGAPMDAAGTLVYSTSDDVIAQPNNGAIRTPKALSFFDNHEATIAAVTVGIRADLSRRDRPVPGHDGRAQ
jgi:hypothetical protein